MVNDNKLKFKIEYAKELLNTSPKFCNQKMELLFYTILDLVVELVEHMIADKNNAEDDLK